MSNKMFPNLENKLYKASGNAAVGTSKKDQQRHAFMKEREPKQLITVKIPRSLYRELKEIAFKTDDKMTPIIIRLIEEHIRTFKCE